VVAAAAVVVGRQQGRGLQGDRGPAGVLTPGCTAPARGRADDAHGDPSPCARSSWKVTLARTGEERMGWSRDRIGAQALALLVLDPGAAAGPHRRRVCLPRSVPTLSPGDRCDRRRRSANDVITPPPSASLGCVRPVQAAGVTTVAQRASSAALVGRDAELQVLGDLLASAREGSAAVA